MADPYGGPENGRRIADIESSVAKTQSEVHGLWRAMETLTGEVKKIADAVSSGRKFNWEQMGVIVGIVGGGSLFLSSAISEVKEEVTDHVRRSGHPALSVHVADNKERIQKLDSVLQREMRMLDEILQREMKLRNEANAVKLTDIEKRIDFMDAEQRARGSRVYGTSDGTEKRLRVLEQDWTNKLYRGGKRD